MIACDECDVWYHWYVPIDKEIQKKERKLMLMASEEELWEGAVAGRYWL